MKKLLSIAIAVIAILALTVPVMAQGAVTDVTLSSGGGSLPIVKCKWEQDDTSCLEDGDASHATPGSQFLPPGVKCGLKMIYYYAVVTDEEDGGNLSQVYADVYHPTNSPPPYSCSDDPRGPYFKYEIPFVKVGHDASAIALLEAADCADLVTYGSGYTLEEIITQELEKGTADLWYGYAYIDYEQPCGDYEVYVYGVDQQANTSAALYNTFEYVCTPVIEVDFGAFTYGSVTMGTEKMVAGDRTWDSATDPAGSGQIEKATIRNVGNVWASPVITQDDMGFGKDINDNWNVSYDARMGNDQTYYVQYYPDTPTTLPNYLDLSSLEELDLSIKVIKGTSGTTYTGAMCIEAVAVCFIPYCCDGSDKPDPLTGVFQPCPE